MNDFINRQEIVNHFRTAGLDVNAAVYLLAVTLIVAACGQALAGLLLFVLALYFLASARTNVRRAEGLNANYRCFSSAEIDFLWNNC